MSGTQAENWQVERKVCKRVPWLLLNFNNESYLKFKYYILEYEHKVLCRIILCISIEVSTHFETCNTIYVMDSQTTQKFVKVAVHSYIVRRRTHQVSKSKEIDWLQEKQVAYNTEQYLTYGSVREIGTQPLPVPFATL